MDRFKNLIDAMPVKYQAFTTKYDTWSDYVHDAPVIDQIFDGQEHLQLSRADLFEIARSGDLERFFLSVIMWGYPRGMRGHHFSNILTFRAELLDLLKELQQNPVIEDWTNHYSRVSRIRGMGMSTYTKLLYFIGAFIGKNRCLIFDDRIVRTFNKRLFTAFWEMENARAGTMHSLYPKYIEVISGQADAMNVESEKIELFLFQFGINLKVE